MNHDTTGGPAFPAGLAIGDRAKLEGGMTLRDYFAGQALIACRNHSNEDWLAERAYKIADAMLKARAS